MSDPVAVELLSQAHTAGAALEIFQDRVKQRPLNLLPTTAPAFTTAQVARRQQRLARRGRRKQKPAPLSSRQKRALCLYDVDKAAQRYEVYQPLHDLWTGYILETLSNEQGALTLPVTAPSVAKICSADFHGAHIRVTRSTCVSRVGVQGIVIKDSRGAFQVITKTNQLKLLPKEGTVFEVRVRIPDAPETTSLEVARTAAPEPNAQSDAGHLVFEILGNQFLHRAADRATKKFRWHFMDDV